MAKKSKHIARAGTSQDSTVTKKESTPFKCPVCDGNSVHHRDVVDWGEMRRCLACGLIFAHPLRLPKEPTKLFEEAYLGHVKCQKMEEFHKRVIIRDHIEKLHVSPLLTPDKRKALNWIKDHFPQGSYILDIGCGLGEFIDDLRQAGFNPIGLDASISAVERLRRKGHTVLHGTVDDIPGDLPEISVCTCFRALHHFVDPLGFFQSVRRRFPTSWLLISEPTRYKPPSPEPPRHLTIWSKHSLQVALSKAGYDAEVSELDYDWKDFSFTGSDSLTLLIKSRRLMLLSRRVKPVLLAPLALWALIRGNTRLAFACAKPVPVRKTTVNRKRRE